MDELDFDAAIAPLSDTESSYYTTGDGAFEANIDPLTDAESSYYTTGDGAFEANIDPALAKAPEEWDTSDTGPTLGDQIASIFGKNTNDADIINKSLQEAEKRAASGDTTANSWLSSLSKAVNTGDSKVIAALVQGGFGMLAGAANGKAQEQMLNKKYEIEKQRRDEEWARKDARAAPGKVVQSSWGGNAKATGLLGSAIK